MSFWTSNPFSGGYASRDYSDTHPGFRESAKRVIKNYAKERAREFAHRKGIPDEHFEVLWQAGGRVANAAYKRLPSLPTRKRQGPNLRGPPAQRRDFRPESSRGVYKRRLPFSIWRKKRRTRRRYRR